MTLPCTGMGASLSREIGSRIDGRASEPDERVHGLVRRPGPRLRSPGGRNERCRRGSRVRRLDGTGERPAWRLSDPAVDLLSSSRLLVAPPGRPPRRRDGSFGVWAGLSTGAGGEGHSWPLLRRSGPERYAPRPTHDGAYSAGLTFQHNRRSERRFAVECSKRYPQAVAVFHRFSTGYPQGVSP